MKKLALIICVLLGLTGVARAQNPQDELLITMPISAICLPTAEVQASLMLHGESPFAIGNSIIWHSIIGDYIPVLTVIYANPKTFSFTVAYEVVEDKVTCVTATGDKLLPATKGPKL